MDPMLFLHISTIGLLLILSIIILWNSIKTKNKLVMYLSIATIVISLGSLIYFLIEHFNKQHHANNHVTLPAISVSKAYYRKTEEFVKKMLKLSIETTKPSQTPPPGYTPSPDDFTESENEAMKKCLTTQKVVTDLTNQLISRGKQFIEKIKKVYEETRKPPPTDLNMTPKQLEDYEKKLYQNANTWFKFQDILLTVMGEDCHDVRSVIAKMQTQTKRTRKILNEANNTLTNQ